MESKPVQQPDPVQRAVEALLQVAAWSPEFRAHIIRQLEQLAATVEQDEPAGPGWGAETRAEW